jgi:hypothetical protein
MEPPEKKQRKMEEAGVEKTDLDYDITLSVLPKYVSIHAKVLSGVLLDFFVGTIEQSGGRRVTDREWRPILSRYGVRVLDSFKLNTKDQDIDRFSLLHLLPELTQCGGLAIQFVILWTPDKTVSHRTLIVYDTKRKEAFYFDSNGPSSTTTPECWRIALKFAAQELGFETKKFFMDANPQAHTQDSGCSAWSSLGAVLCVQKFLGDQSVSLTNADFYNVMGYGKFNLQKTLQTFMEYTIDQMFGKAAVEINYVAKLQAFKEIVKGQGLNVEEDVLNCVFDTNDGIIEKCLISFTT